MGAPSEVPLHILSGQTDLPDLIHRWLSGESLAKIAREQGLSDEGLRKRIKSWSYRYSGDNQTYKDLAEQVLINRMVEAEEKLEESIDSVGVARAREVLNHSRWVTGRRLPQFADKQETRSDNRITITIHRPQSPVLVNQQKDSGPSEWFRVNHSELPGDDEKPNADDTKEKHA